MSVHGHIRRILQADYGLSADAAKAVIATVRAIHPDDRKRLSAELGGESDFVVISHARSVATIWRNTFTP